MYSPNIHPKVGRSMWFATKIVNMHSVPQLSIACSKLTISLIHLLLFFKSLSLIHLFLLFKSL